MNNPAYIYGLYCPLDGTLKYIGMTNNPPARYSQHLTDKADTPKVAWLNTLREHGLKPIMGIIEECTEANVRSRELFWIEYYLSKGIELTNSALGFEPKSAKSVARYYMSHLRPKRRVVTVDKTDNRQQKKRSRKSAEWLKVEAFFAENPDTGKTYRQIADELGVSVGLISKFKNS